MAGKPSKTLLAIILALAGLLAVEGGVRIFLEEPLRGWDYWSQTAVNKFVTYFGLQETGKTPSILVVGDSSADYGFSPETFNAETGCDHCSYNLATLGNFALSFDKTINDMVLAGAGPKPEYLFIIFTRGGFENRQEIRPSERSILQSPVVVRARGEWTMGHLLFLGRMWRNRFQLINFLQGKPPVNGQRGFIARDDQTREAIEPPKESEPFVLDPDRLEVLEHTLRLCLEQEIEPVVIHPPIHTYEAGQWEDPSVYNRAVAQLCADRAITFWDFSQDHQYDKYMRDLVHLDGEGAVLFSKELARRFANLDLR